MIIQKCVCHCVVEVVVYSRFLYVHCGDPSLDCHLYRPVYLKPNLAESSSASFGPRVPYT